MSMRKTGSRWPPPQQTAEEDVASEWSDENQKTVEAPSSLVEEVRSETTAPHAKLDQLELAHSEKMIAQAREEGYVEGFARGQSATFRDGMEAFEAACRVYLYAEANCSLESIDEFVKRVLPFLKPPPT